MTRRILCTVATSVALSAMHTASEAGAQDIVAGWEGQRARGYAFVAPGFEPIVSGEHRLAIRASASYLYYEYAETEGRTEVRSPGGSVSIGYRLARPRVALTFGPGFELRRTERRQGPVTGRETEVGLTIQGDVFARLSERVRASFIASYGQANKYVWSRGGILYELNGPDGTGSWRVGIGLEATGQGNRDAQVGQLGGVLDFSSPRTPLSLQVRVGAASSEGDRQLYLGIGAYRQF